MSRKGNCLDNAPIESFFLLFKTEALQGFKPCNDIDEFRVVFNNCADWYNNVRTSRKTNKMCPVQYRISMLAT
ncbi:IS3 family transposase [Ligilactobacillus agilis]|uniref:IS3 family transposase n=1 Tax=Ligilactobacillus agilis TaxID=1601 RepID=UPI000B8E3A6C